MQDLVHAEIIDYLNKEFSIFNEELKELIASVSAVKSVEKGNILIHAGQYLKYTILLVQGRIKLFRESENGEEAFMYYLEPGNACALSMLCAARQKVSEITAKAIEDSIVIMIPIQFTDELMKSHKSWYNFVIETYRSRFEELLEVFDNVVFKSMDERLEWYLKNQFKNLNTTKLQLTHQEIANDLNTSREVVSRLLKKLEQSGHISLNRKYIEKIQ